MRETLRRCYHARLRKNTRFARSAEEKASVLADAAGGRFLFGADAIALGPFTVANVANEHSHAADVRPSGFDGPAITSLIKRDCLDDLRTINKLSTADLNALAIKNNTGPSGFKTGASMGLMRVWHVHRSNSCAF